MEKVNKNNKVVIFIVAGVILLALILSIFVIIGESSSNNLNTSVNKTTIEEVDSYKMDLRIFGTYNNTGINDIIMVTNYQNTDKDITITRGEKEEKYLVKDNKKYSVVDEKLKEVDKVPYEDTEIYLNGVKNLKDIEQVGDETISDTTYKVYKGTLSSEEMNKIIDSTELDLDVNKDAEVEVWLTTDNYVYKIYYRIDKLTIYPSYFGYGNMNKVNLDMYKA